ncbi:MAG: MBL fold metallo-hydrolase [Lachnospiraceae bacterium]|nr:MBL fold metallo-hydrolase [Lachnospiraceae bacterium]
MVNIKIHRGTNMIGGSITEIYTENTHIFIDFGSESNPQPGNSSDLKMIEMINSSECDAVLFSHYHGDHVGLLKHIPRKDTRGKEIKLGMGLEARKVLIRIHKALSNDSREDSETKEHQEMLDIVKDRTRWIDFFNKESFTIGDFKITTVKVDHSAYDAYMFIIQAEGKTIVHTGDYRTHGRLGTKLFPDLQETLEQVMDGKQPDVLLTEGTMLERRAEKVLTEEEMEEEAYELLKKPENKHAFLMCSSTNVESLASFCNAARRLKRPFLVSYYVYDQICGYRRTAGAEDERLLFRKTYKFEKMDKINPNLDEGITQPEFMKRHGFLMLVSTSESYVPRMEYFRENDPLLIYSMWEGYINKEKYPDNYKEDYGKLYNSWRHTELHTAGHATVEDIEKMIAYVNARVIIPIHTTRKDEFDNLNTGNSKVVKCDDGDVYSVL